LGACGEDGLELLPVLGTLEVALLGEDFLEDDFDGRGLAGLVRLCMLSLLRVLGLIVEFCDRSKKRIKM
jgi:hypothetical protein